VIRSSASIQANEKRQALADLVSFFALPTFAESPTAIRSLLSDVSVLVSDLDLSFAADLQMTDFFSKLISLADSYDLGPAVADCLAVFVGQPDFIKDALMDAGFAVFAIDSRIPNAIDSLAELVSRRRSFHEQVLEIKVPSDFGELDLLPCLLMFLEDIDDESEVVSLCRLMKSFTAFPLTDLEVAQIIAGYTVVINRNFLEALPVIADGVILLLKRQTPPPVDDLVSTLFELLTENEAATPSICIAVGMAGMDANFARISELLANPNMQIVAAAGWCLATVAQGGKLRDIDIRWCIESLHSAFESAPYGVKLSLAFPIVTLGRLVDDATLLALCEGGLIETLAFALGTKAVALLDAALELLVSAVCGQLGPRFVAIGVTAGIVGEIEKVVDADDFRCLAETRIPDMVGCLLAAIARESDGESEV
jgi:hypothetical protein